MATTNRQFLLKSRPQGDITAANFTQVDKPLPDIAPGQALVRTRLISLDPTNRIWMSDQEGYMPPIALGDVVRALGLGTVVQSKSTRYQVGDVVSGLVGWQDYVVAEEKGPGAMQVLPVSPQLPLEAYAGVLGMTGITAYFGLLDLGKPKRGETVLVSAAAGAVGSVVGQIAAIEGCRTVGLAGSDEKCRHLRDELGYSAAVNYKSSHFREALREACPQGIDINFENVGGDIMATVLDMMNLHGRVVLCGLISGYNSTETMRCPVVPFLMKRLSMQGFIILDYVARYPEAIRQLEAWVREGKIKHHETVVEGLERAPTAINMLFRGENLGKLLVRVS